MIMILPAFAGVSEISLNSSKTVWKVRPADKVDDYLELFADDFSDSGWVKAVVPGTVFGSYAEQGLEKNPNFGDNIHNVDRKKYNKDRSRQEENTLCDVQFIKLKQYASKTSAADCQGGGVESKGYGDKKISGNPIFEGWYADPEVIIYDDKYWIYPTYSAPYEKQTFFDCFSSPDLVNWTKHERIIDSEEVSWANRAMWAPGVIEKDGKYYFFFAANDVHEGEVGGIGVGVADSPEGPYKDLIGKPLINEIVNGAQPIDQYVFEQDGSYYMYYGGWGHCNIVKLHESFTRLVPFEDGDMYKEVTPEGYVEGPCMFKKNGKYYFMWSEGGWGGPDYSVAYAISDSIFGPFERLDKILEQDASVASGAGHHSVANVPGSEQWYIVYHRRPLGETDANHRVTCIDRMEFDENGRIKPVEITFEGVEPNPID
nr:glycoside hydrolase family 43 protein [Sedimentisphaera cyanobacteriorum]